MDPAGMVHALELIHDLLAPGGLLIDIHPSSLPPVIQLLIDGEKIPAGWLQESDDFIEYRQASAALQEARENGWFELQYQGEFVFTIHAASLQEFQEYLAQDWKDAILTEETIQIIAASLDGSDHRFEIVSSEHIMIARYQRGRLIISQ